MLSERVIRDLEISEGWTPAFAAALAPYYVATLTHMSKGHPTPVFEIIDTMWHAHILSTRDYAAFCDERFGRFIHHERGDEQPAVGADPDFFRHYGLSLEALRALCGAARFETARCGEPDEPIPPVNVALARCGEGPAPPSIGSGLAVARCGDPAPPSIASSPAETIQAG